VGSNWAAQDLRPAKGTASVVTYLLGRYRIIERRAAMTARFRRSSLRYQSRRDPQTALRQRKRELAETRVRLGYRRLLVLLRREGWDVGKHRLYRVYSEEGLALRRKCPSRHRRRCMRAAAAVGGAECRATREACSLIGRGLSQIATIG
jgi:hypothetical protein